LKSFYQHCRHLRGGNLLKYATLFAHFLPIFLLKFSAQLFLLTSLLIINDLSEIIHKFLLTFCSLLAHILRIFCSLFAHFLLTFANSLRILFPEIPTFGALTTDYNTK
jgi:hypothetical protein